MKGISRLFLIACSVLLAISIFVPLWSIDLNAPQYPEGLTMLIHADGVKGDVEIINGLNHYIGMKTIHNKDFIEFTILPYLICFFAVLSLLTAIIKKRELLLFTTLLFILFGIIAMYDFWRWEYDYGHNLNPNAAIIVPGMAYQPPLLGYKQLLNFAAYSFPAIGGWLFIASGLLMVLSLILEYSLFPFKKKMTTASTLAIGLWFLASCTNYAAEPISLHKDHCEYCKMTISDGKFASEIKTQKGRCLKFDDIGCLFDFMKENTSQSIATYYVNDFEKNNNLIDATQASFLLSDELLSPMEGHIAAFQSKSAAEKYLEKYPGEIKTWSELKP